MKILITRTAPFKTFEKALLKVNSEYPEAEIHVLIQRSVLDRLQLYGDSLIPIAVSDGPLKIWREGIKLLYDVRKKNFDIVILLYSNPEGRGYFHVDLISLISGSSKELICDTEGNIFPVQSRPAKLLKRLLHLAGGRFLYEIIRISLWRWENRRKAKHEIMRVSDRLPVFDRTFHTSATAGTSSYKRKIVFVDLMFTWPPHGGACVDIKEIACRLKDRGYGVDLIVPRFPGIFPRGDVNETMLPFSVHKVDFSAMTFNFFYLPKKIKGRVEQLKADYVYLGDSYFLKPYLIEALKDYRIISRFYTYELLCPNYYLLYKNGRRCEINYLTDPIPCLRCAVSGMKQRLLSLNWEVWSHEFAISMAFLSSYHQRVIRALRSCYSIITYNELASNLLSLFHPNVVSFSGGVNASDFIPSNRGTVNRVKKILVSGRLSDPRKGLDFFLETVRRLRRQRGDFEVYLTIEDKFQEDYIVSLGWVEHDNIKRVYQDMDFCVVPSLWEEPFGMVAVEAMAAGRPVIASNAGGLKTSVEDGVTGFLFPPGDSDGLTRCLNRLLDEPGLIKRMGKTARARVEQRFDWECIVDRYCKEILI